MMKTKSTKRALLLSALALLMCVSMLVGSTFAWFTDSVSSVGNKIQAGTLELDLELLKEGTWTSIKESKEALFNYTNWEPGYTDVKVLKVENEGSLALKWKAKFVSSVALTKLADVIDVYVLPSATELNYPADRDLAGYTKVGTLAEFVNTIEDTTYGQLEAKGTGKDVAYLGIALKMQESAGNEYQGLTLGGEFDIVVVATQAAVETDSFDNMYDQDAAYAWSNSAKLNGANAVNIQVEDNLGTKVGSAEVPAEAVKELDKAIFIHIDDTAPYGNITVSAGEKAIGFDVTVENLKENNTAPVKVTLNIPAMLDPNAVELYHYANKIDSSYNPYTGVLTFESATFSPFTVVYEAESEYVPPVATPEDLPEAEVVESPEYVNTPLAWGSYGQWSPTEGLDANLETAYTFKCVETEEEAWNNPYANWYCDFYVMLDRELGENQIFLGGNYGIFGWVGFHNGDTVLEANEEIGLLKSASNNPWTYYDVAAYVGEFICGVGDVDNALTGATFTVKLRLTNPENSAEFYDIETINYTFN